MFERAQLTMELMAYRLDRLASLGLDLYITEFLFYTSTLGNGGAPINNMDQVGGGPGAGGGAKGEVWGLWPRAQRHLPASHRAGAAGRRGAGLAWRSVMCTQVTCSTGTRLQTPVAADRSGRPCPDGCLHAWSTTTSSHRLPHIQRPKLLHHDTLDGGPGSASAHASLSPASTCVRTAAPQDTLANTYRTYITAWYSHPAIKGILQWGFW